MADWSRVHLADIITVKHGYAFPGDRFSSNPNEPRLITPANFRIGGGFKEVYPLKTFSGTFSEEFTLPPDSLIVTMTDLSKGGDTLGLPAKVPKSFTYLHNQRIGLVQVVRPGAVSTDFLHYYLRSEQYRQHILATASGSTVRHTSPTRIRSFVAQVPPLWEQLAIAEVFGALDAKIAANDAAAELANELAATIFAKEASRASSQKMIDADPILGGTPKRTLQEYWNGDVTWASARDVAGAPHGVIINTAERISECAASTARMKPLPTGSVLLTARGTVGAVARIAVPSSFNQSCYGFKPGAISESVLYFSVLQAVEQARSLAHGSVFNTITTKTFDHLTIPSFDPAASAQLESELKPLLDSITAAIHENVSLADLRDTLLPHLMAGRLRVKDAEKQVEAVV